MLKCNGVSIKYDDTTILSDVTFSVNKGDYLFIIGENGSGKTSLIKALLGLLPVSGGNIELRGVSDIGYVSQETFVQSDFPASVYEIVLSGCVKKISCFYRREHKRLAMDKIREMGLYDVRGKCFRELSGGQRRRTLLARAMCACEKLLILDEPMAGLDCIVSTELYNTLHNLNQKNDLTVIMVSHDIENAIKYATRILHIDQNIAFFGSRDAYVKSGLLKKYQN